MNATEPSVVASVGSPHVDAAGFPGHGVAHQQRFSLPNQRSSLARARSTSTPVPIPSRRGTLLRTKLLFSALAMAVVAGFAVFAFHGQL